MIRKITYWGSTGIIAVISTLAGFTYLVGSPEIVQRFQPVGYPEQLRILLGIAKALGVIVLLIPGFLKTEGVGVRWIHFCFLCCDCGALYGPRSRGSRSTDSSSPCFVSQPSFKTSMALE